MYKNHFDSEELHCTVHLHGVLNIFWGSGHATIELVMEMEWKNCVIECKIYNTVNMEKFILLFCIIIYLLCVSAQTCKATIIQLYMYKLVTRAVIEGCNR